MEYAAPTSTPTNMIITAILWIGAIIAAFYIIVWGVIIVLGVIGGFFVEGQNFLNALKGQAPQEPTPRQPVPRDYLSRH